MRRLSNSDRAFWEKYGISPDAPSRGVALTTEQLMDAALRTVQQMTPEEKTELRRLLDASFGRIRNRLPDGQWIN
jgi:hypothetical protein